MKSKVLWGGFFVFTALGAPYAYSQAKRGGKQDSVAAARRDSINRYYLAHLSNSFVYNATQGAQVDFCYYFPYIIKKRVALGLSLGLGVLKKEFLKPQHRPAEGDFVPTAIWGMGLKFRIKDWMVGEGEKGYLRLFQENNFGVQAMQTGSVAQMRHYVGAELSNAGTPTMFLKIGTGSMGNDGFQSVYANTAFSIAFGFNFRFDDWTLLSLLFGAAR